MIQMKGYCPMGCGETLFLVGRRVQCSALGCPRPAAVDELLAEQETEHVVEFEATSFTVQHPLRERLDEGLFNCGMHSRIAGLSGPPVQPGRYRAIWSPREPGGVLWLPVGGESS